MALDFDTLLAAFLHRAFLAPNRRFIGEADVAEELTTRRAYCGKKASVSRE